MLARALQDRFERRGRRPRLAHGEGEHRRALADPKRTQPRLQLVGVEAPGQRLGQHVAGHVALQQFVALVEQLREHALGDRDEGQLIGHLEQREAELARRVQHRGRHLLVHEAGAEAEPRDLALGQALDEFALGLCAGQLQAGREQELSPAQPRRGVEQLARVHPAHVRPGVLLAGGQRQVELGDQALDGQHGDSSRTRLPAKAHSLAHGRLAPTIRPPTA